MHARKRCVYGGTIGLAGDCPNRTSNASGLCDAHGAIEATIRERIASATLNQTHKHLDRDVRAYVKLLTFLPAKTLDIPRYHRNYLRRAEQMQLIRYVDDTWTLHHLFHNR
jgi:hypothetical protein